MRSACFINLYYHFTKIKKKWIKFKIFIFEIETINPFIAMALMRRYYFYQTVHAENVINVLFRVKNRL